MSSSHNTGVRQAKRRLLTLILLCLLLGGTLGFQAWTNKQAHFTPDFALDLEGGTELILTPKTTDNSAIGSEDVNQAIEIIRQRVDASGVAEAEITSQGGQNIVVGLPGQPSKETLDLVRTSAVLRMRPVLAEVAPTPLTKGQLELQKKTAQGQVSPEERKKITSSKDFTEPLKGEELKREAMALADSNNDGKLSSEPATKPANASDQQWASTEQVSYDIATLDCTKSGNKVRKDDPTKPLVACRPAEVVNKEKIPAAKLILGPAEIEGTSVKKAASGFDQQQGKWVVNLEFNSQGAKAFSEVTGRLAKLQAPMNRFAIVLDSTVISDPAPSSQINQGSATISGGGINAKTSKTLADKLQFGSLPLEFEVQSEQQISATLGSESLKAGLIAGVLGLLFIVGYLLWQYHALGIVAIGSVVLATGLSYFTICLLSATIGYRLSMAGVVGLIISIGITADSFIIFFERIRDEIREGQTMRQAVARGWHRARRTIIISDGVNLIAASVLYFIAVGSVRGFAFTLGLTTILDLIIVFIFTFPVMTLLVRTEFFGGGHKMSGMSAAHLNAVPHYRGRARIKDKGSRTAKAGKKASAATAEQTTKETKSQPSSVVLKEHETNGMSLAERRAAERRANAHTKDAPQESSVHEPEDIADVNGESGEVLATDATPTAHDVDGKAHGKENA